MGVAKRESITSFYVVILVVLMATGIVLRVEVVLVVTLLGALAMAVHQLHTNSRGEPLPSDTSISLGDSVRTPSLSNGECAKCTVSNIPVGGPPANAGPPAFDSTNGDLYFPGSQQGVLYVVPASLNRVVSTIPTGFSPLTPLYDPTNGYLYISNHGGNTVEVVDGGTNTVIATLTVGVYPWAPVLDPANGNLYVSNRQSNNLSVISTSTNLVVKTIPVGSYPQQGTLDTVNGNLYVSDLGGGNVTVVSTVTEAAIGSVGVGNGPSAATYDPSNGDIYVPITNTSLGGQYGRNVTVISGTSDKVVASVGTGGYGPETPTYDPKDGDMYVPDVDNGVAALSIIAGSNNTMVAYYFWGGGVPQPAYDPFDGAMYISNYLYVRVLSGSNNSVLMNLSVGTGPQTPVLDNLSGDIYVSNSGSSNVSVIGVSPNRIVGAFPLGNQVEAALFNPQNGEIYVPGLNARNVTIISGANNHVVGSVNVGVSPQQATMDSGNDEIFLPNLNSSNLSVISSASDTVISSIPIPAPPSAVGYDSVDADIYVSTHTCLNPDYNCRHDNVSVVSAASNTVVTNLSVWVNPQTPAIDNSKGYIMVPNIGCYVFGGCPAYNNVTVLQGTKQVTNITVGGLPQTPLYVSGNGDWYVSNANSNNVSVISEKTLKVIATVNVGTHPGTPTLDPANGDIYVPNQYGGTLSVISSSNNTVIATISPTVSGASGPFLTPTFDPGNGNLYVSNGYGVLVVSGSSNSVLTDIPLAGGVQVPAYDSQNGNLYASVQSEGVVAVIPGNIYNVTFDETGLPTGSGWVAWAVNFTGVTDMGYSSPIQFDAPNGTYAYSVDPIVGWTATPSAGSVTVAGSSVTVLITFTRSSSGSYMVSFSETGLPSGTNWSIALSGHVFSSTNSNISFSEPNGTYPFTVGSVSGYASNITSGIVTVNGGPVSRSVTFSPQVALTSVTVSPPSDTLKVGTYANFTATPSCSGGSCSGVSYSWSLSSTTLGVLNTTSGPTVKFTAGGIAGVVKLSVLATANGVSVTNSSIITITTTSVPTLAYVSLTPLAASVNTSGSQGFTAIAGCSGGACPAGVTYTWSMNNSLGTLNTSAGTLVLFTANSTAGYVTLTVLVGLNGKTATNSSAIAITKPTPPPQNYTVTFSEVGLANGTSWGVSVNWATGFSVQSTTAPKDILFNLSGGSYRFYATNVTGYTTHPWTGNITVNGANLTQRITYVPSPLYSVTFNETGLPSGTPWSVSLNGVTKTSTSLTLTFLEPNGTYPFTVGLISGYTASPSSGAVVESGGTWAQNITFTKVSSGPPRYNVTFKESGLPLGITWSVAIGNLSASSVGTSIPFRETNGTYSYTLGAVAGYVSSPSSGSIVVKGSSVAVTIVFTAIPPGSYLVTFSETGLPTGANWSVTVAGKTASSTGSSTTFVEKNGSYNYTVTAPTGYTASPSSGGVTVAGKAVSESVTFTKSQPPPVYGKYSVTFTESGLPSGASWSVTLNGSTQSSTAATITFSEANGSYSFTVGTVSGYTASPPSGTVKVNGASTGQAVTFTSSSSSKGKTNQTTGVLGLPGDEGYIVIGAIVVAVAIAVGVLLMRRRRNTPPRGGDGISERKKIENQSAADGASKEQAVE